MADAPVVRLTNFDAGAFRRLLQGQLSLTLDTRKPMECFVQSILPCSTFAVLVIAGFVAQPAQAQSVEEFYRGKTISIIIGGTPGGGFDTLARAIGRHIGRHIPGDPAIVAKNMPGAGGTQALDHLYNTADKDGTVMGLVNNTPPFVPLFSGTPTRFDATKFSWLGTPSVESPLVLIWQSVPVNSLTDLQMTEITVGASGANSAQAFYSRLINATLHTKMKIVSGYRGQNDIFIAMERREVDGYPSVFYSSLTSTRPTWLPEKIAKVALQYGPEPLPELPGVAWAPDHIKDTSDKTLFLTATAPNALGRPLLMPPDVPADRLAAVRKALMDTFNDPAFQTEAGKIGLLVNAPRTGQQLAEVIRTAYAAPPDIVARVRELEKPEGK
jgi:tripartite-type tricarboxylate transporter receptor subunit TctC